ncbi:MAG: ABC transporter ATP-binding protein [Spirochaetaceae bacterium]|nr:MAG: ABC transporter ATP-binding protein [Spirochaetaceae bacterium]
MMSTVYGTDQENLLEIRNLSIRYRTRRGELRAVEDATLLVKPGESVAIIGESGSGKTTLISAIVRMLPLNARLATGTMRYRTAADSLVHLDTATEREMRPLRWKEIVMVFQASQSSFNPVSRIYTQFLDTARAHNPAARTSDVMDRSRKLLELVALDGEKVLHSFPHELSGGMKQRTLIALGLLLEPRLIILDEPTTALDLLTQKKILKILRSLRDQYRFGMVFVTHDLGIVSRLADRVVVMYAGSIVEDAPWEEFYQDPKHPYSQGLIRAVPKLTTAIEKLYSIPGTTPDLVEKIQGCPFAPRCPFRMEICTRENPPLLPVALGRSAACHLLKEDSSESTP